MNTITKKIAKHWILIWLVVIVIALSSFVAVAQYTGLIAVKRVVTTQASPGQLFSSNCMWMAPSEKKINAQTYSVTVCNYEQKDNHIFSTDNINYTLTAELCVLYSDNTYKTMSWLQTNDTTFYNQKLSLLGSRTYKIGRSYNSQNEQSLSPNAPEHIFNSTNGFSYTFPTYTLTGRRASTDKFQVTFDSEELNHTIPDFYIYLKAKPAGDELDDISCYLCASQNTESVSGWHGSFMGNTANGKDYDFYNYILSGTGKGTVQVWYNPEYFEINPYFTAINSASDVTDETAGTYSGWKTFTIDVTTAKSRYEIQLYKKKKGSVYTNQELNDNIHCSYTAEEDQ